MLLLLVFVHILLRLRVIRRVTPSRAQLRLIVELFQPPIGRTKLEVINEGACDMNVSHLNALSGHRSFETVLK